MQEHRETLERRIGSALKYTKDIREKYARISDKTQTNLFRVGVNEGLNICDKDLQIIIGILTDWSE